MAPPASTHFPHSKNLFSDYKITTNALATTDQQIRNGDNRQPTNPQPRTSARCQHVSSDHPLTQKHQVPESIRHDPHTAGQDIAHPTPKFPGKFTHLVGREGPRESRRRTSPVNQNITCCITTTPASSFPRFHTHPVAVIAGIRYSETIKNVLQHTHVVVQTKKNVCQRTASRSRSVVPRKSHTRSKRSASRCLLFH